MYAYATGLHYPSPDEVRAAFGGSVGVEDRMKRPVWAGS